MSNKRALTVGFLTAGLSVGVIASVISPAAAQGNPVGGEGNLYFLSGAYNPSGIAQKVLAFGDPGDEVYYGNWDGNANTADTPMVRRGITFFVSDQNGQTVDVFQYGNLGDTVLVGDWDGDGDDSLAVRRGNQFFVKNDTHTSGKADTEFYYGDAGDTVLVGNWDGDTTNAKGATVDTDTLIVQRDNKFFVKNDLETGTADYTFYFGDKGDDILVGDWYIPETYKTDDPKTKGTDESVDAHGDPVIDEQAQPADGRDQLAVRRGFMYHLSNELADAHDDKENPATATVFAYGDAEDTVFVANMKSVVPVHTIIEASVIAPQDATLESQPGGVVYDTDGVPLVDGYQNGAPAKLVNGVAASVDANGVATPATATVTAWDKNGKAYDIKGGDEFKVPNATAGNGYLFNKTGVPYVVNFDSPLTVTANTPAYDKKGNAIVDGTTTEEFEGDGLGVRRGYNG